MSLHNRQLLHLGTEVFDTGKGVAQGSILSPLLFNLVLEEALKTVPHIQNIIKRHDLRAYADDIEVQSSSLAELRSVVHELDGLGPEWGLLLNKRKCVLLRKPDSDVEGSFTGIETVTVAKYLGLHISHDLQLVSNRAKSDVTKYIGYFKGRLRGVSLEVKEHLILSFARSLMLYFGTPLVAARIWDAATVESIERRIYRRVHLLPNDVNGGLIVHISR